MATVYQDPQPAPHARHASSHQKAQALFTKAPFTPQPQNGGGSPARTLVKGSPRASPRGRTLASASSSPRHGLAALDVNASPRRLDLAALKAYSSPARGRCAVESPRKNGVASLMPHLYSSPARGIANGVRGPASPFRAPASAAAAASPTHSDWSAESEADGLVRELAEALERERTLYETVAAERTSLLGTIALGAEEIELLREQVKLSQRRTHIRIPPAVHV